jgi:hypothetical protein
MKPNRIKNRKSGHISRDNKPKKVNKEFAIKQSQPYWYARAVIKLYTLIGT